MNCDSIAMMSALYPGFINETIPCHASCITQEGETYGQVLFYKEGFQYDAVTKDFDYNVTLVNNVDKDEYLSCIWTLSAEAWTS